jgi:hypothetical protein
LKIYERNLTTVMAITIAIAIACRREGAKKMYARVKVG